MIRKYANTRTHKQGLPPYSTLLAPSLYQQHNATNSNNDEHVKKYFKKADCSFCVQALKEDFPAIGHKTVRLYQAHQLHPNTHVQYNSSLTILLHLIILYKPAR